MEGAPQGAELHGDSLFVWSVPDSFIGADTVLFIATDNAILPLSDTDTVIITVSAGSENHAPEWSDDTLEVSMNDTGSYRLPLFESCSDPDEDELDWELLPGAPDGDTIIDGEYRFGATSEAIETHYVRIVAMDVDSATDTLVIELTVERIPDVGFFLRSLRLSAGTSFPAGTEVTLTATAKAGYRFGDWSGDASGSGKSVTITMTKNMAVTANFVRQYTLTMVASENGEVGPTGTTTVDGGQPLISPQLQIRATGSGSGASHSVLRHLPTRALRSQRLRSKATKPWRRCSRGSRSRSSIRYPIARYVILSMRSRRTMAGI